MAHVFEIELPDGELLEIEAPENTAPELIKERAKKYVAEKKQKSPQSLQARMNAGDQQAKGEFQQRYKAAMGEDYAPQSGVTDSFMQNATAAAGSTLGDTLNGLMQYASEGGPIGNQARSLIEMTGVNLPENPIKPWIDKRIADKRALDAPLLEAKGGTTGAIAGNVAQMLIPGASAKVASYTPRGGAGLAKLASALNPTTYAGNIGMGAAMGATQPVIEGESRAANAALGATLGAGGQATSGTLNKLARGSSESMGAMKRELYNKAKEMGIPVTASQLSDSRFIKFLQSTTKDLPFTGAESINRQQVDAYTKAAAKRFGVDTDSLTPDVLASIDKKTSDMYDKALQGVKIRVDKQANNEYQALRKTPGQLTVDQWKQFDELANSVSEELKAGGGTLDGRIYQTLRDNMRSAEAGGGVYGDMVRKLRDIFERNTERNIPANRVGLFKDATARYRDKKLIDKAMGRADTMDVKTATEGKLNPTSLQGMRSSKYGISPEMDDMARIGQMIKDTAPNSGTPIRQGILGGAVAGGNVVAADPTVIGGTLLGLAGANALNSKWLGRYAGEGLGPRMRGALDAAGSGATALAQGAAKTEGSEINQSLEIKKAAFENVQRGPEILSNLPEEEEQQAAEEFAQQTGMDVNQVIARLRAERERVNKLMSNQ